MTEPLETDPAEPGPGEPAETPETERIDPFEPECEEGVPEEECRGPGRFRRLVLRPVMWFLAGIVVLIFLVQLLLDTPSVRQAAAERISEVVSERIGRPVGLEDVDLHLIPPSVELWGLSIGSPPEMDSDQPFLRLPWAEVQADFSTLRQGELRLALVRIERPKVYLHYLPDGIHNVKFRKSDKPRKLEETVKRPFDIIIERVEVVEADFFLDQESVRLSISGDAVRARFEGAGDLRVAGRIAAQNVVVRLPDSEPYSLAVSAKATVERGRVVVEAVKASGPDISGLAHGECTWNPLVPLDKKCIFEIVGDGKGQVLRDLGYFPELWGEVHFDGNLAWRPGAFGYRSRVSASRLAIWNRELEEVEGIVVADRHRVRLSLESAGYGGGRIDGTLDVAIREPGRPMTVDLGFADVLVDKLLEDQNIPAGPMAARASGQVLYQFPIKEGTRGDGRGEVQVVRDPERPGLALAGSFPLRIEGGVVRTEGVALAGARQSILASGYYDVDALEGKLDYEVASADLRQIIDLIQLVPEDEPWPLWLPTHGEGRLEGSLELGAGGEVVTEVALRLEKVRGPNLQEPHRLVGGFRLDKVALDPFRMELADGTSALTMQGRIPIVEDDPRGIELAFDSYAWSLAMVHPWLDFELPLEGRITGRLDLHVDAAGSDGILRATVEPGRFYDLPFTDLSGRLHWDAESLRVDEMAVNTPAGEVLGHGVWRWIDEDLPGDDLAPTANATPATIPRGDTLDIELWASSLEIGRSPLARFLPRQDLSGEMSVTAHFGGRRDRPELDLDIELDDIALGARRLGGRSSRLDVHWADGRVEASGRLLEMATFSGGGPLTNGRSKLVFALDGHDVGGLLELFTEEPPVGVEGHFDGLLEIARQSTAEDLNVVLELDEVETTYRGRVLRNVEPVWVELYEDHWRVGSFFLEEEATGSELFLSGRLGWEEGDSIDLRLQASLATSWLELEDPIFGLDGRFDVLGRIGGTLEAPYLDGQGELSGARLELVGASDFPHAIDELEGMILFYPDAIVIDHLRGRMAGGRLRAEGRSDVPREGQPLQYQLNVRGEDLRIYYPEGWLLEGDTELTLRTLDPAEASDAEGGKTVYLAQGRAELERIEFSEDIPLGFAQVVQSTMLRRRLEVGTATPILSAIELDVVVDGPEALRVQNNLADLSGSIDLVVRGTLAEPILYGTVDLAPGGDLIYSSVDYEIDRGRLTFANPYEIDPEVDLVASTRVRDFDVTLTLSGPAERLEAGFSSEPPLPALEVFQLLATGGNEELESNPVRRADEIGEEQSMSAASFLYGQAASAIGDRVSNLFGFDKFRIDPLTGSGDNLSKARVTVGKRLSKDIFVSYSADPASTEEQRLQIEWQLSRNLVLVLTQNGDNTYEADARWEMSF